MNECRLAVGTLNILNLVLLNAPCLHMFYALVNVSCLTITSFCTRLAAYLNRSLASENVRAYNKVILTCKNNRQSFNKNRTLSALQQLTLLAMSHNFLDKIDNFQISSLGPLLSLALSQGTQFTISLLHLVSYNSICPTIYLSFYFILFLL